MVAMSGTWMQGFSPGSESRVSCCVTDTARFEMITSSDLERERGREEKERERERERERKSWLTATERFEMIPSRDPKSCSWSSQKKKR